MCSVAPCIPVARCQRDEVHRAPWALFAHIECQCSARNQCSSRSKVQRGSGLCSRRAGVRTHQQAERLEDGHGDCEQGPPLRQLRHAEHIEPVPCVNLHEATRGFASDMPIDLCSHLQDAA